MSKRHLIAILAICALAVTGSAAAATSHVKLWTTPNGVIACGYKIHTGPHATELLCASARIPAPSGAGHVGDPGFVQLARTGSPQRLRLSQDSFVSGSPVALHNHTTWSGLGVTCTVRTASVRCRNTSGHGFTITATTYSAF